MAYCKKERIADLESAQEKINEAVTLITKALDDTGAGRRAERYIIGHLDNWANGGASLDETLPDFIKIINEEFPRIED